MDRHRPLQLMRQVGDRLHLVAGERLVLAKRAVGELEARRRVRARQIQLLSSAASPALHLPDGPAARRRDAYLREIPRHLAWIQGYDALAAPENQPADWRSSLNRIRAHLPQS